MRFYLDEDLSDQVARAARAQGLDVVSSHELGRDGWSDDEQLRQAAEEGRCFVTRNRDDFIALTTRCLEHECPHEGVLIVPPSLPNARVAAIVRALVAYAQRSESFSKRYTVDYLRVEDAR